MDSNLPKQNLGKSSDFSELKGVIGVDEAIEVQREKLHALREGVKKLTFKKIDIAGNYSSITKNGD